MNAELVPFRNGEHNSETAWIIDRVITPLSIPERYNQPILSLFGHVRLGARVALSGKSPNNNPKVMSSLPMASGIFLWYRPLEMNTITSYGFFKDQPLISHEE